MNVWKSAVWSTNLNSFVFEDGGLDRMIREEDDYKIVVTFGADDRLL